MTREDPGEAAAILDGLIALAARLRPGEKVPPPVMALMRSLHEATMSDSGPREGQSETLADVTGAWSPPEPAGVAVGYTGRHVRRLCDAGRIRHTRPSPRVLLVDVDDLRRHVREQAR